MRSVYDQHIASYLELMKIPYTGCNPRGLILARGKDLSKTVVHHRRIAVTGLCRVSMRRKVKRPARLALPLIVKSLNEDGSFGIVASVHRRYGRELAERVAFGHERLELPPSPNSTSKDVNCMSPCSATIGCESAGLGIEIRQHGRSGGTADCHRKGQTRFPVIRNASEL